MGCSSHSPKGHFSSSGDESTDIDSFKGGYTSGAFNTDEEPIYRFVWRERKPTIWGSIENPDGQQVRTVSSDPTRETATSPGSG